MATIHEMLDFFNLTQIPLLPNGNPDVPSLKRHIKRALLQHHPDKGGDRNKFSKSLKMGRKLLDIFDRTASQENHQRSMEEYDAERLQAVNNSGLNVKNMNEKKFNDLWNRNIGALNKNLHERGYSEQLKSEEAYNPMQIVRAEPNGFGEDMTFENLGESTADFSGDMYGDLMKAYAEPNREAIRSSRMADYGSVSKLKAERSQLKLASREEQEAEKKRRDEMQRREDAQRLARHRMHVEQLANLSNGFMRITND